MDPSFGARLRSQRERQQVTLTTIAEQTKIKLSLLEGLERDDVSHWPTGIFRRSYVRAYARAIGLEPDTVLREFLAEFPDPSGEIQATVEAPVMGRESTKGRPPMRLRFLIGSAINALPTLRVQSGQGGGPAPGAAAATDADSPVQSPVYPEHDRTLVTPAPAAAREGDRAEERVPDALEWSALARLCTRLARAAESGDVAPVLEDAATLLHAVGLVLWLWDPQGRALRPVFSHGYSDEVVAHLPGVASDTDNAIASAFRSAEPCVVDGSELETGAVVVPLTTPTGCAGVLALELRDGGERRESVRAFATILAAQLSSLVGYPPLAQAASA